MTEWRLFEEGTIPVCSTTDFFEKHPWVSPHDQTGHAERTAMVERLVRIYVGAHEVTSLSDLGCGDGAFLDIVRDLPVRAWGYDAGAANVSIARNKGLDVRQGDILTDTLEYGELITCNEVVEHMADPHGFLRELPGSQLVLSSPSAETDEWHYVDHTWAWDMEGYEALVTGAGWQVIAHDDCDGGFNHHGGVTRSQRFQAIVAVRPDAEDEG